jgi:hypothetical protein
MKIVCYAFLAAGLAAQQPSKEAGDDRTGYTDTPQLPNQKWKVHDAARPRPPKVTPPPYVLLAPPSDAIVLFDGKDLSKWEAILRGGKVTEPKWQIENGAMKIVPRTGRLRTKEKFGHVQVHVEWMIPKGYDGAGQGRGNSGVELMGRYEVQVLESHENLTYADGQAGSIYGQWPPLVNVCRPEGEWNVYDIFFEAPRFEGDKLVKPAYMTVVHNGVLVHHRQEVLGRAIHRRVATYTPHDPEEPLSLQDHGRPVYYRNIWVRRLKGYDSAQ